MIFLCIVGFLVGYVGSSSATSTVDYSPETCRPDIAGSNNYRFSWFPAPSSEDPLLYTPCCSVNQEYNFGTYHGLCREDVNNCNHGFAVSMWLQQIGTTVSSAGSYLLSTGAQRSESCGFYIRVNSINQTANHAEFDVGIATETRKWHVLFVAQIDKSMHLIVTWKDDLGMDVYVDGQCAGGHIQGTVRNNVPTCGNNDPFRDFLVGRRNDKTDGYCDARIGRLYFYFSWKKPTDLYDPTTEGAALTYYQGCIDHTASASLLTNAPDHATTTTYSPASCRSSCREAGHRHAALTPDDSTGNIDCFCLDTLTDAMKVDESQCSSVCPGFATTTCGSPGGSGGLGHLSVYITSAFDYSLGAVEPISGFNVELIDIDGFTATYGQRTELRFTVDTGNSIVFFVYGDQRVEEMDTKEQTARLVFQSPGTYHLTAAALNAENRQEKTFTVTILEDIHAIKHLSLAGGVGEVNRTSKVQIHMVDGNDVTCDVNFGDDQEQVVSNAETIDYVEHVYASSGEYNVSIDCSSGYSNVKSSALMTVLDSTTIEVATSSYKFQYGSDQMVQFSVKGTNVSEVTVTFDGTAMMTSCDEDGNCELWITSVDYNKAGSHVLRITADNKITIPATAFLDVFIGTPVDGLTVDVSTLHVFVNESFGIGIGVTSGTDVFVTLTVDNVNKLFVCELAPCSYNVTVILPTPGGHEVGVEASNDFTAKTFDSVTIVIYKRMPSLTMTCQNVSSLSEAVDVEIEAESSELFPNNSTVSLVLADNQDEVPFDDNGSGVFRYHMNPSAYNVFTITANISNPLEHVVLTCSVQIGTAIDGLTADVYPDHPAINEDTDIIIGITEGNPLTLYVDFGDGNDVTHLHDISDTSSSDVFQIDSVSRTATITHVYQSVGVVSINITAYNTFGSVSLTLTVTVSRDIQGLQLLTNTPVTSPNAVFELVIALNESAPLPFNATCNIDFGDSTSLDDVVLNVTHSANQILHHVYAAPHGEVTISVVCSNKVSVSTMTLNIVVVSEVTTCELDGQTFIETDKAASFQFSLDGSHIQLGIDLGDGSNVAEQWDHLPSEDFVYSFEHSYSQPGLFNIEVVASNQLGSCMSNVNLNVQNPIQEGNFEVAVIPEVANINDPTVTFEISLSDAGVQVPSQVTVEIDFGDTTTTTITYPLPDGETIDHTYSNIGIFRVSFLFRNLVSEWTLVTAATVMAKADGFVFNSSPCLVAVDNDATFTVSTATGSNVTYTVDYGDDTFDSIFKETASSVAFTHAYSNPGNYVVTFEAKNLLNHLKDNSTTIHIVTPISGLAFEAESHVIYSPGNVGFTLSQSPGSRTPTEMTCTHDYGDGSNPVEWKDVEVSENISVAYTKTYPGGLFEIRLTCSNPLSETFLTTKIKVYETISNLKMEVYDPVAKVDANVTFAVTLSSGSFVLFSLDYGDGMVERRNITQSQDARSQTFSHHYQEEGNFEAKVTVSNGVTTNNNLDYEVDTVDMRVYYGTYMFELSAESSGYIPPGEVHFTLSVSPEYDHFPSEANLKYSFGDDESMQVTEQFNNANGVTTTHVYESPGMYEVAVVVSNPLESSTYTTVVVLSKKAPPLLVFIMYTDAEGVWSSGHGPELNWMPVKTELKFFANTSYDDLDTTWSFGDESEDIASSEAFHLYHDVGWYNVTLKLHNDTHMIMEEYYDLFVVSDPISLRLSEGSTEDVWMNSATTFALDATVPPGPACISWDMGDSSAIVVYGPSPCVQQAIGENVVFVELDRQSVQNFEHSHTYHAPGYYKVRISVENFVTILNATVKGFVAVKGCSGPIQVSFPGTGQDKHHPRIFIQSERIPLDPSVHFPCVGVENPEFIWTAEKLTVFKGGFTITSDYEIEPFERPKRTFSPLTFKSGLYEVKLAVIVPDRPSYIGMSSIFLKIEDTPLVLRIVGGESRAVGSVDPLKLDAVSLSSDPDEPERDPSTWRFNWTCFRVPRTDFTTQKPLSTEMEEIPRQCDRPTPQYLPSSKGTFELDAMSLRVGSIYSFKVKAYAGSTGVKTATKKQYVVIEPGDLPAVSIKCVTNCKGKMNPTSSYALQGSCTNCPDSIIKFIAYKWEMYIRQDEGGDVLIGNLSAITSTGDGRAGLNFIANVLEPGKQYRLRLSIQPPSGTTGYSEFTFKTNLPPYNGTCSVSPPSGFAISTKFSVACIDWLDEGSSLERASPGDYVDDPYLTYKVLQRPQGEKAYSLMYSGENNLVEGLLFGVGPSAYNYTFELKVQVADKYGAKAERDLTIKVTEKALEAEELDTLIGTNSSYLQQLIAAGDAEGATQLITAVISVLSDQGNSSSEFSQEEVKEIQTNLLEELAKVSVWATTIEDLYSAAGALSQATGGSAHAQALFSAATTMARMASRLESVSDNSPEEVLNTAEGLTSALGNLMTQSQDIVSDALVSLVEVTDPTDEPEEEVDEYAAGAVDPELEAEMMAEELARKAVELEGARFAAKTISGITERTLDNVANVLCGQQVSGQPPIAMDTGSVKAEFYVDDKENMAGRALAISGGSADLPDADILFPDAPAGNLKQKFYAFTANPHAYDTSNIAVGSEGAIKLDFETETNEEVKVQNLTKEIAIVIENKNQLFPIELVFWKYTINHRIELPMNDSDLCLIVNPGNITDVKLYVKYGEQVNVTNYDYVFTIPRNLTEDESWEDEEIREEGKYSVRIPTSNGTGAGIYFVAIALPLNLSLWDLDEEEDPPTADVPTVALSPDAEYLPTADFTVYVAGCRYWNEAKGGWISDGCRTGPLTNSRYTQCLCTHLSDFTSSFFVPPNSIDFSTVFLKFKDLGDNPAVFATVFALLGVYLILIVWMRRKDKQDVIKWGVTPLADNKADHTYYYQITLETGMRPGSGTSSKVGCIISGDLFDTGIRVLDDNKREVFARGSVCHFLMAVEGNLGPLSYMKIFHDNSGEGEMAGWYLSKVSVLDIQTGEQFFFICERWLAVEQDDGNVNRVLPVATKSDMTQFSQLFFSSSREKLFDDHLWFSLFTRPTKSSFTRVQRLSCCLSLLYTSMIANAMFYRSEENVEKSTSIRLGPFIFSGQQVFVGFISALVVVPINVAIVQVFRKSKPSKKDSGNSSCPEDAQRKLEELENPGKTTKKKVDEKKLFDEKPVPEPEEEFKEQTELPEPEMITEEEFALRKAYKPSLPMEMIDEAEEYNQYDPYQYTGSTETILVGEMSQTESMMDIATLKSQSEATSRETVYDVDIEATSKEPDDDEKSEDGAKKKKEEFMLPHWCVYIGWFLFVISCLVSAFFTILYSLEWGAEKANEWLTAMLLSFFNSVVLIQPVKVLVIVTVLSLIFKKAPKMDPDSDELSSSVSENRLNTDEEYLHKPDDDDNATVFPFRKPLSKEELALARKRRFQEIRMYNIIRETVIYTMYVMILLTLCYTNRDTLAFYVSKSIRDNFVRGDAGDNTTLNLQSLTKSTPDLFWDWMDKSIIPGLYGNTYYNGEPMHWRHSRFIADWQSYRVGPARLRQLRVTPDHCIAPKETAFFMPDCYTDYDMDTDEERSFFIGWQPQRNKTYKIGETPEFIPEDELVPWRYQDTLDLNGVPYPGKRAMYAGGGFVAEFGVSMKRAFEISQFLRDNEWYDTLTRAIFLEFTVYNANTNLFSVVQILVELPTTGGGVVSNYVHTFRLYHYAGGAAAIVAVIFQLCFVAYIIYFSVKLIVKIRKEGKKELLSFWTFLEALTLCLAFVALGLFAIRQIFIFFSLKEVRNKNEGKFVNFAHIAKWDELFGYLMAFLAYLAILRYMRLLRLSPRMLMFGLTMSTASSGIICFSIMFSVMFFAFGQMGNLLFGHSVYMYSSLMTTMETLFAMMLGSFEFEPLRQTNGVLGPIFFLGYIVSMFFILSNMFITLISDAFADVNSTSAEETGDGDTELVDFMIYKLKTFLSSVGVGGGGGGKKMKIPEVTKGKAKEEDKSPIDLIESRVNKLLDFVNRNYGEVDLSSAKESASNSSASLSGIAVGTVGSPDAQPRSSVRSKTVLVC